LKKVEGVPMMNEELVALIQNGENVSENMGLLYQQNKGLIYQIIKGYSSFLKDSDGMQDLMQESYFGLYTAAFDYDASLGFKFMTYAGWIIKGHISRYIRNHGNIKQIPSHMIDKIALYNKTVSELMQRDGCTPTDAELMEALGMDEAAFQKLQRTVRENTCYSLEATISSERGNTLNEVIADSFDLEEETVEEIARQQVNQEIWQQVDSLGERQKEILKAHFRQGISLEKIGKQQGCSRQRVREIEQSAFKRLKEAPIMQEAARTYGIDYDSSAAYHGGFGSFKEHGSSIVEYLALKSIEQDEKERDAADLFNQLLEMV
jgi:RNA polymerase primary sigma factor